MDMKHVDFGFDGETLLVAVAAAAEISDQNFSRTLCVPSLRYWRLRVYMLDEIIFKRPGKYLWMYKSGCYIYMTTFGTVTSPLSEDEKKL